jgi:hypothetical protein
VQKVQIKRSKEQYLKNLKIILIGNGYFNSSYSIIYRGNRI